MRREREGVALQQICVGGKISKYPLGVLAIYSSKREKKAMQNALKLSIEGMHCGGCVRRVTTALEGIKGVELGSVEVGSAQLTFQSELASSEEIASAVNRIGFTARLER